MGAWSASTPRSDRMRIVDAVGDGRARLPAQRVHAPVPARRRLRCGLNRIGRVTDLNRPRSYFQRGAAWPAPRWCRIGDFSLSSRRFSASGSSRLPSRPMVVSSEVMISSRMAVDGRIGDLGEELLEVVVEQLRPVGEHGQGGVVAHRADRFGAVAGHGRHRECADPRGCSRRPAGAAARSCGRARAAIGRLRADRPASTRFSSSHSR